MQNDDAIATRIPGKDTELSSAFAVDMMMMRVRQANIDKYSRRKIGSLLSQLARIAVQNGAKFCSMITKASGMSVKAIL